jgi:hypothetical protein
MAKITMLSCPRFEPYTKRPDGATATSAAVLSPVNVAGSVESRCSGFRAPVTGSKRYVVIVESSSLIT